MTPERLAEIRAVAASWPQGDLDKTSSTSIVRHRADLLAEVDRLLAEVEKLTDRVIAAETNRVDAADLQRENDELRRALAETTSEAAIAKLREWTAGGVHPYEPGASYVAMPTAMACKIADEIDALTRQRNAAAAAADRIANRAIYLRAERNQARAHLHRLVDHQDDECQFDHHGTCQAHFVGGSEPGKCGVVEARQFLAEAEPEAAAPATPETLAESS